MKNLKIGARIGLGFGVVLLVLAAVIIISIARLGDLNAGTSKIVLDAYPKVVNA